MKKYISFIRGINVGGKNRIKMDALKTKMSENGFSNCQSYIQSGNLIFETGIKSKKEVKSKLESIFLEHFNLSILVYITNIDELTLVFEQNHFTTVDTKQLYFTFLLETPNTIDLKNLETIDKKNDEFEISNTVIYINCIGGYSKTKLSNAIFEKKLNVPATTRNWNTLSKMILLAEKKHKKTP